MNKQNLSSLVQNWWEDFPIEDPVSHRLTFLLQVILLGSVVTIIIAMILNLFFFQAAIPRIPKQTIVIISVIAIGIIGILIFLLLRGFFRGSVFIIIAVFLFVETLAIILTDLRSISETLVFFTLAIFLASLFIGRQSTIAILLFTGTVVLWGAFRDSDTNLKAANLGIAVNFILLNGLMALFLNEFGTTLSFALKAEQERRREAENLRQAAAAISSTLDPDHVMTNILNALKKVIHYDNASVFLQEGEWLRLAICQGFLDSQKLIGLKFPAHDELFEEIKQCKCPLIIEDAQKDPRFKNWGDSFEIHGWMSIPLIARGNMIGYITLDNYQIGAYSEGVSATAMAFANQAAVTLENARLYQEQMRRSKIIEALADIANEIATTRDVLPALEQITHRALDLLGTDHVAIYLLQDDNVTLKTVAAHGTYRNELLSHTRKVGEGITGTVFLNAKAEIINDTHQDPRRVRVPGTPEKEEKIQSLMSAPLILRGKTIGVINAWRLRENGLFNESELNFLVGIAHQVSICIESGRLFQETMRRAQEAAAIAEVGRDISATLQLNMVLERIALYAMDLLHSETSAVYLAEGNLLRAIAALGIDAEEIKHEPLTIGKGILGNIVLQNKCEIVNDPSSDQRAILKGTEKKPLEHLMGVPILLKDKHTGLLAVWRSGEGTDYKENDREFLTSLARQAAVAIENARLYTEIQQELKERERAEESLRANEEKVRELNISLEKRVEERTAQLHAEKARIERIANEIAALRKLSDFLQASLTIEEACNIIASHMNSLFSGTSGALYLTSNALMDLNLMASWGNFIAETVIQPNDCWGMRRGRMFVRHSSDVSPSCSHFSGQSSKQTMCLPLLAQNETIGMLCMEMPDLGETYFTSDVQNLAVTSVDSIALALANLRLRERLHHQTIRDPLTGIFNRRFMEETLEREVHRAGRNKQSLCVIMFEIDDFKRYNNTFGHDAGDYVLKKVTDTMRSRLRRSDFPCRYGGDEFTLILPDTTLEDGAYRAEELRKAVEALALSFNNQALGQVTVRMGVAAFPKHGETGETVLKVADDASYRARAIGKNCVVVAE